MRLKQLGTNKSEVTLNESVTVLFSYETPVAYTKLDERGKSYFITDEHYSATTTRHIKSWLPIA